MKVEIRDCSTTEDVQWLLGHLRRQRTIAFDIETTCDKRTKGAKVPLWWDDGARIVSCAFTWAPFTAAVLPLSHPSWSGAKVWRELLAKVAMALAEPEGGRSNGARLVAHNSRYDLGWFNRMSGVDLSEQLWWDTMLGAQVLDENTSNGLKDVGAEALGIEPWGIDLGKPEDIPWPELKRYNAMDTIATYAVAMDQIPQIREVPALDRLMRYLLNPAQREYLAIEARGTPFDREWCESRQRYSEHTVEELEQELLSPEHTPQDLLDKHGWTNHKTPRPKPVSWAPTSNFFKEWIERKGAPVIKVTGKGAPSWDESVLHSLQRMPEHAGWTGMILEHRGLRKELDAFLTPWLQISNQTGDRLHPAFKLATVVTGRTASEYPNIQQVPKELKPAFRAPHGWVFFQADYSQIELRVAAWLFKEPSMMAAYLRGEDLHTLMAAKIAGIDPSEVTKAQRQNAKAANFGFLYGMGVNRFCDYALNNYGVDYSQYEATRIREAFFDQWSELHAAHERYRQRAWIDGEVRTPFGRRRRLPEARSRDDFRRSEAERQAINSPIQATGSDLLLLSVVDLSIEWRNHAVRSHILGSVHDSVLGIAHEDDLDEAMSHLETIMCYPATEKRFGFEVPLPLAVEVELGPAWGETDRPALVFDGR